MIRKALFVVATMLALTGCEIYFGPTDPPPDCGPWGCEPPPPTGPGGECQTNYDCMSGCYCSPEGYCEEAGFCQIDAECPFGFVCDDRASCVPAGSSGQCMTDEQCPYGSYCDELSAICLPSWTCWSNEECGPGFACDERGTCVPVPCDSNDDCFQGCYCDVGTGTCVETGVCTDDSQCFDGMTCDERGTCVPRVEEPPPPAEGSCDGTIECAVGAPICEEGTTPGIDKGCYTGFCIPLESCDVPPLAQCDRIENENQCFSRPDCRPTYIGVNCTCNGAPCLCSDGDSNCVCESFEYAGCVSL